MSETKHTPGPWVLEGKTPVLIRGGDGLIICQQVFIGRDDAEFIIRACNEHDSLTAQRDAAKGACEAMQKYIDDDTDQPVPDETRGMIRTAIAKAKP